MSDIDSGSDRAPASKVPLVSVVIVNYRTSDLTLDCLNSLADERSHFDDFRVIVADSASADGSVTRLRRALADRAWESWVDLLPLDRNRGFASATNAAIRSIPKQLAGPYVLLLNPDTRAQPGALAALVEFMQCEHEVGIAGSRLVGADGQPQVSAFRFPGVMSEFEHGLRLGVASRFLARWSVAPPIRERAHLADWVSGASMLVRRRVFEEVGLLDEGYFLFYEELDFCLAARRVGWACAHVPRSRVVHLGGRSTGISVDQPAVRRPAYWFESRRRFFTKNFSIARAASADLAFLLGFGLWRVRRMLQRRQDTDPPHFLGDFLRSSVLWRGAAR